MEAGASGEREEGVLETIPCKLKGRIPHLRNAPCLEDPDPGCVANLFSGSFRWPFSSRNYCSVETPLGLLAFVEVQTACPLSSIRAVKGEVKKNSEEKNALREP